MAPTHARRARILACAIYSRIHTARNDYLHGNRVSDVQLVIEPSKRFLLDYAPVLYRMALTGFLDLRFKKTAPNPKDKKAYEDYQDRIFKFEKYQRDMESALATFNLTIEQHRRRTGRDHRRGILS